jgi:L-malate glycosyltransferase
MRVLYFTSQNSPHDQRFLNALVGTTHQVFSLRMHASNPETPEGITEWAWPEGLPDWSCWQGWQHGSAQLREIIADLQPDLVHAGPVQGPALVTALAGFHPLVSMSWGFDLLRIAKRSPWMRYATGYVLEHSDILVADCQTVIDEAASYGFPRERVVRFPWGVDLAHFSPENAEGAGFALRQSLGWDDNFVVVCNRAWSAHYGVDILAQAFVHAHQKRTNLRLLLAGSGPQSNLIRKILAPVQEAVHFPGWIDMENLPGFYGAGDLFVSPSYYDGSSVSLMEALACARPVLVSDIPSNREWVKTGEVGDLFSVGESESLAHQLSAMASDPHMTDYGQRGRILAEERANWDVNFKKLLVAYQMALA